MIADASLAGAISRRRFMARLGGAGVAVAGGSLLAACGLGSAPATIPRVYRVGYLGQLPFTPDLLEDLAELGYIEGTNLVFEPRVAPTDELAGPAAELVRLGMDCIVTQGPAPAAAAKEATAATRIPVVGSSLGPDPVARGLVASFGHPGGNVTGLAGSSSTFDLKRIEVFMEAVPGLTRVAIFKDSNNDPTEMEQFIAARQALGPQLRLYRVNPEDAVGLEGALEAAVTERADGLDFTSSVLINRNRALIVDFMARSGLPAVYPDTILPPEGALMALGDDTAANNRRVAAMVDKVLRGTSPSEIPVESATAYKLIVNLKTAQALGLTIPQSVLIQATEVIR